MDSIDSETFYIITLFQQGSYRAAISSHLSASSPSPLQTLYAARSHLALTPPAIPAALSLLNNLQPSFNQRAIISLAHYLSGETERAINDLEEVLMDLGDGGLEGSEEGRMVRGVVGTVYFLEGGERRDEGIEVLREAVELGGDSECLAILTHLYLLLSLPSNSADLLQSQHVQSFTLDSTLSQLLTAQTNLATGPSSKYQEAFYVYEEIKSMQGGRCESILNGLGTCNAAMGKWSEAGKELQEGLEMNPSNPTSLANAAALALHLGRTPVQAIALLDKLRAVDPNHAMLIDLDEKENLFDTAAGRFGISA